MKTATQNPRFFTKATALNNYLLYLSEFSEMAPQQIVKNERWIRRIDKELGKSVIEATTASEINNAILSASQKRRMDYNGGEGNEGRDLRFRLGQSVKCFLEWAYSERIINRNPYPKNPFKRPPVRDAYFISHEKISLLYHANLEPIDLAVIRFLIDTGVRISELCNLKRKDVDFGSRTATIYMSKVNRLKTVPFSELTKDAILAIIPQNRAREHFIFYGRQGAISSAGIRVRLRRLGKQFGFRMNPHAFRHAAGTMWVKEVGEIAAQKLLGHTSLRQTAHYTHLLNKDLHGFQKRVQERFNLSPALPKKVTSPLRQI